ncbi:MAG TPA: hypothetical protein VHL34_02440, partial [Rhizomicrobium sp.]|nr:hypothetical protein [Rhizomicrobium sp.]
MSKDRRSFRLWLAAAAAMFGLCSTPALADGCEPLVAALLKGNSVPWHSTVTLMMQTTVKDKAEVVSLPDAIYSRSGKGEWKKKPRDAAAAAVQIAKDWERKTCRADGTETIGGVPADIIVYRVSTR